ncbi:MAG: hypothetical protein J2P53_05065 [Bradyrhizobiaceae bacterium]|nr:hypothetical protein [Bradyrhizobiaceae bacterium]
MPQAILACNVEPDVVWTKPDDESVMSDFQKVHAGLDRKEPSARGTPQRDQPHVGSFGEKASSPTVRRTRGTGCSVPVSAIVPNDVQRLSLPDSPAQDNGPLEYVMRAVFGLLP